MHFDVNILFDAVCSPPRRPPVDVGVFLGVSPPPLWVWGVLGGPPHRPPVGVGGFWESPPRPLWVWGVLGGPPRRPLDVRGFEDPPAAPLWICGLFGATRCKGPKSIKILI
jgi:hypothetical protein